MLNLDLQLSGWLAVGLLSSAISTAASRAPCRLNEGKGFASPAAVFKDWVVGLQKGDSCRCLHAYAPADRSHVIDMTYASITVAIGEGQSGDTQKIFQPRLAAVLKKYHLDDQQKLSKNFTPHSLRDAGNLFVDLRGIFPLPPASAARLQLVEVKVEGETATGLAMREPNSAMHPGPTEKIEFNRIGSGWFLHEYRSHY